MSNPFELNFSIPEKKEQPDLCEHGNQKGLCGICDEKISDDKKNISEDKIEKPLPQVDANNEYIDSNGKSWNSIAFFLKKYKGPEIDYLMIRNILKEVDKIKGKSKLSREALLFDKEQAERKIEQYLFLPKVNKDGKYVDKDGKKWGTAFSFRSQFDLGYSSIRLYLNGANSMVGRGVQGKVVELYDEDEINKKIKEIKNSPRINLETGNYVDENGQSWMPISLLTAKYGSNRNFMKIIDGEVFIWGRVRSGARTKLYSEKKFLKKLRKEKENKKIDYSDRLCLEKILLDGNSGINLETCKLKEFLDFTFGNNAAHGETKGKDILKSFGSKNLDMKNMISLVNFVGINRKKKEEIGKGDIKKEEIPQNWKTVTMVANEINGSFYFVKKISEAIKADNPQSCKLLRGREYFAPELLEIAKKEVDKIEKADDNWKTKSCLSDTFKIYVNIIEKIVDNYRLSNPEYFRYLKNNQGKIFEHYSPELIEIIKNNIKEKAPQEWKTPGYLQNKLGLDMEKIKRIASVYRDRYPEYFRMYRSATHYSEHYSPELVKIITEEIDKKQSKNLLRDKLNNYLSEIESNNLENQEVQKIREIMSFFPERTCDVLYKYHPEFKGLPVDYVKSVIAEYLGDFLLLKKSWQIDDIELVSEMMSDKDFSGDIFLKLKDSCFVFYQEQKKQFPDLNEYEIIQKYLHNQKLLEMAGKFEEVGKAVEQLEEYYRSIFQDFRKPDSMVGSLKEGRKFPDINQLINIKELSDNKKMLIADDMGLGKSASVIMAKEYLACSCALIVAPSNVVSTWENYLSDKKGENGKNVGYFKEGMTPKVLVIRNSEDLGKIKNEVWDYVLISQEKLNEEYTQGLSELNYDMLIADEIHKLKNIKKGIRSQNIIKLAEKVSEEDKYLAILSGTPIPNKVKDLAISLKLLYPEKFKDLDDNQLVQNIILGDIIDIRSLLLPRMQMKSKEGIEMPELEEEILNLEMSEEEKEVYSILLEEDELIATEKIQAIRKFLLNPELLEMTPEMKGSKIEALKKELKKSLEEYDKIVVFVNGYIEGVIREKEGVGIIKRLDLPKEAVKVIDGNVPNEEREAIQKDFNYGPKKTIIFVSGQTADVGVDFSGAQRVFFYNEPWSQYDKKQQLGRVYREGIKNDLKSTTLMTGNSLEQGINYYIRLKEQAVERLLRGIPITEIENKLLRKDERRSEENLEVDPALAKYYLSSWDKLLSFFSAGKGMGEKEFKEFLKKHGEDYANSYMEMGSRTYQGNNSRAAATIIGKIMEKSGLNKKDARILDIASGPEMLKNHSPEEMQKSIFSTDINPRHFIKNGGRAFSSSFLNLPIRDESFDFINLALAMHYTKFVPSKKIFESLKLLEECNRTLKTGGVAIVSEMYNLEFKNEEKFREIVDLLGFEIMEDYSGVVSSGENFEANFVALRKKRNSKLNVDEVSKDVFEGLKFVRNEKKIRNSRMMIGKFSINGKDVEVDFNENDRAIFEKEQEIIKKAREIIKEYGKIETIPKEKVVENDFSRVCIGKNYSLFKRIENGGGFVLVKN